MKAFIHKAATTPRIRRKNCCRVLRRPGLELQRKQLGQLLRLPSDQAGETGEVSPAIESDIHTLKGSGQGLPGSERNFFGSRFGADFSAVRIHNNTRAARVARSVRARAFTLGNDVVFGDGEYRPGTSSGRRLIAHELTHVVQQGGGPATGRRALIQRQRIPTTAELEPLLWRHMVTIRQGNRFKSVDLAKSHREGLKRLVKMAKEGMKSGPWQRIETAARSLYRSRSFRHRYRKLPPAVRKDLSLAIEIGKLYPLGKPGKHEVAAGSDPNMAKLYKIVRARLQDIYRGKNYANWIDDVFGKGHVRGVKQVFENAYNRLYDLRVTNSLFIDKSGYRKQVGVPGAGSWTSIVVSEDIVKNYNTVNSRIVFLHESLHAGNKFLNGDPGGYNDGGESFRQVAEKIKLRNADHYTVIAWRILNSGDRHAHKGQKFRPARKPVGRRAPARLSYQQANRLGAYKVNTLFGKAIQVADDLHDLYREIYNASVLWNFKPNKSGTPANSKYSNTLPYWSAVENLTIHKRAIIKRSSLSPAYKPVTAIDVALSEAVVRKLNQARNHIPTTAARFRKLFQGLPAGRLSLARGNPIRTQNLIISIILHSKMPNLFGHGAPNDTKALKKLASVHAGRYSTILIPRLPKNFP